MDKWYERPPLRLLPDGAGLPWLPIALPDVAVFGMRVTALQYAVAAVVTLLVGVRALLFLALCCEPPPLLCRCDVRSMTLCRHGKEGILDSASVQSARCDLAWLACRGGGADECDNASQWRAATPH